MLKQKITKILKYGESIDIEFKECKREINKDAYETVCAFLNRSGGELLLGVNNKGIITGIDKDRIEQIKVDFVTAINNPQKISPSVYLSIEELEIEEKNILYIYIPESSQVHRCGGKIFDRNEEGDFNITDNTNLVSALYIRKQTSFSENMVFPFVTMAEFRSDLIQRCRKRAVIQRQDHPWASMTDEEMVKSAQLFKKDWQTGKEGFTLAAILLLGKDDVILSAVPHHRTDAILRKVNTDRYDDRDFIATNLIESYSRLMAFAEKHLPDPFYLEGDQRISLRSHIFREIIVNSLIHREYLSHFPARFVIERDKIFIENANKPHGFGVINIKNFTPFPKNPIISSFFRQIHFAEELGSGFRKVEKYAKAYFGIEPIIEEKDIFRFEAKFGQKMLGILDKVPSTAKLDGKLGGKLSGNRKKILELMEKNSKITKSELSEKLSISTTAIDTNIKYLRENKLIERDGAAKGGTWKILLDSQKLGDELSENRKRILKLMKENSKITKSELSKNLGISTTAIENNINYLRENKLIERVGPDKGGSWKILS